MKIPSRAPGVINLAIIGASQIAAKVLPSIRTIPMLDVVGVASARAEAATKFARDHNILKSYGTYQECFSDSDVQAVYITNLNSEHAQTIRAALVSGKHVLCEKPMVLTGQDAIELFSLASSHNLILMEGLMYRFHHQIKALRDTLKKGFVGEIKSIRVRFSFCMFDQENRSKRFSSGAGGGALNDLGCYGVDFINSILGHELYPTQIKKISRYDANDKLFDLETSSILNYPNGVAAEISVCEDSPSLNSWEVCGSRGSVSALRFDPQGSSSVPLYLVNDESEARIVQCEQGQPFEEEFKNFAECILGQAQPFITAKEIILNSKVLEAIAKA